MSDYQGEDRRLNGQRDHDLLTRIDVNLSSFMKRFNDHVEKDEVSFKEIRGEMDVLKKYVYIGIGGVLVLEFVFQIIKK